MSFIEYFSGTFSFKITAYLSAEVNRTFLCVLSVSGKKNFCCASEASETDPLLRGSQWG